MKILVLTDDAWNDDVHGNNFPSNWFEGFPAEFANIYLRPEKPYNNCCEKYFQITDNMMFKSIFNGKPAGEAFEVSDMKSVSKTTDYPQKNLYIFLKRIAGDLFRLLRELIWFVGRVDKKALEAFINEFNPDIIFSPRFISNKVLRMEKIIFEIAKKPIVAFTGDEEYSLKFLELSPLFWVKKFAERKALRKMMPNYSLYYTLSQTQLEDYKKLFNCNIKIVRKSGDFSEFSSDKAKNDPIKIVYAGKLYMKRWKTLAEIAKALEVINKNEIKMTLDIYTRDILTKKQLKLLNDGKNVFLKEPVTQGELKEVYKNADIALHVESFSMKVRTILRVAFSTKIIDLFDSGCAIIAIAPSINSGIAYLKKEDSAICIEDKSSILNAFKNIADNSKIIDIYRRKGFECGKKNHLRSVVQKEMYEDFKKISGAE